MKNTSKYEGRYLMLKAKGQQTRKKERLGCTCVPLRSLCLCLDPLLHLYLLRHRSCR